MSDALFRLVGDGDRHSGGAIPLPDAFTTVVNELLAHSAADFRKLNHIISDVLLYKEDRIMAAAWRSWTQFTRDILTVLEEMNLIKENQFGKWELTEEFIPKHVFYLPQTNIGFTGRTPEDLQRRNGNETLHMALNAAVIRIRDHGGDADPEAVRLIMEAEKILVHELGLDLPPDKVTRYRQNNPRKPHQEGKRIRYGMTAFFRSEFWEKYAEPGKWYSLTEVAVKFNQLHPEQPPIEHSDLTGSMRKEGRDLTAAGVLDSQKVLENGARKWKFRRHTGNQHPGYGPNTAIAEVKTPVVTWEGIKGGPKE